MVTATKTPTVHEFRKRLRSLMPDSGLRLLSNGVVNLSVRQYGPSLAWTTWDGKSVRFDINFRIDTAELSDETLMFLWHHELGHIILGHFSHQNPNCGRPDWLVAADISVNYLLRSRKKIINDLSAVDAEQWLTDIGLGQKVYPFFVIHDILHEKVEELAEQMGDLGDACGGIEQTFDPRALARGLIASRAMQQDEGEDNWYRGIQPGTEAGGLGIRLDESPLPPWLPAAERFARSMVETELADHRSHKRHQPTLKSAGAYVPTQRPTWRPVPSILCLLVDTSGSMLGDLHYVSPVLTYLKQHGIRVRLIAGDIRVTFDELIDRIPAELEGGGGTDINPLFDRADEYEPKGIVCFTDGYLGGLWPHDREVPTLWVGTREEPPYGQTA